MLLGFSWIMKHFFQLRLISYKEKKKEKYKKIKILTFISNMVADYVTVLNRL